MNLSEGQTTALKQLERIANINESALRIDNIEKETPSSKDSVLCVDVSLDCTHYKKVEGGLNLHSRESVRLWIYSDFPYRVPVVTTAHSRFLGFNHVQWGVQLCLYQSTETQWQPSRGMIGFINQLDMWFEKAALNELDHPEGPLHPPIAYPVSKTVVCIREDTPSRELWPWFGAAILNKKKTDYYELENWNEVSSIEKNTIFSPALLLDFELPFEYPKTIRYLFKYIESKGVDTSKILVHLMLASERIKKDEPLYFVIGTPSRGIAGNSESRLQHLTVWEIEKNDVQKLKNVALACDVLNEYKDNQTPSNLKIIIDDMFKELYKWQNTSSVNWCSVTEERPEIITRRDEGSETDWFKNKTVSIWGCGALGSVIAEHLVRAKVNKIILYDNKKVNRGILVRQNFIESDINDDKTESLKRRLQEINNEVEVQIFSDNIIKVLDNDDWRVGVDVVIDATASLRVRSKLESSIKNNKLTIPIGSVMISGAAQYGVVTFVPKHYSGATLDVLRRLSISVKKRPWLKRWDNAFWDEATDEVARQPEPGCSEPTFVGSHADVAGLAARMINCISSELIMNNVQAAGYLLSKNASKIKDHIFKYQPDILVYNNGIEFRFSKNAWRDTQGWIKTGARTRSIKHEIGGLLFGQFDEMLGIGWISNVSGPPKDSEFSPEGFVCGVNGTQELCKQYDKDSNGVVQYIGTWHSHPISHAKPSSTDFNGVAEIFASTEGIGSHQLMMIIGFSSTQDKEVGIYAFEKNNFKSINDISIFDLSIVGGINKLPCLTPYGKSIGLALSGGGSRAVAFHLGTLRALEDLGLLDEVSVVSGVSGGSVMTGILGYTNDSFEKIDTKTIDFLKQGLALPAIKKLFHPVRFLKVLLTFLAVTVPSLLLGLMKIIIQKCTVLFKGNSVLNKIIESITWPVRRWYSRTHVMADAIEEVVGSHMCSDDTRNNMSVVLNACELRTGTAFRMSNEKYGSWRYGYASSSKLRLADAVAASAAFPALLPAFDWNKEFSISQEKIKKRVLITDGGVYENLGVSALEPRRNSGLNSISYSPNVIISSDAGAGQFKGEALPTIWPSRMVQVINSVMRKVQDATKGRLHKYSESGELDGFVYISLGQIDSKVALKSPGWINRESVMNYPTDFSAMPDESIKLLSERGEVITRTLVTQYLLSD